MHPALRESERAKGLKRIDFLGARTHFSGLVSAGVASGCERRRGEVNVSARIAADTCAREALFSHRVAEPRQKGHTCYTSVVDVGLVVGGAVVMVRTTAAASMFAHSARIPCCVALRMPSTCGRVVDCAVVPALVFHFVMRHARREAPRLRRGRCGQRCAPRACVRCHGAARRRRCG